jgi:putative endonuclease
MGHYPFIAVYLMTSGRNGTFYIGVTSDLWARVLAHKQGRFEGFSKTHGCTRLVWFRRFDLLVEAIPFEKAFKRWRRRWKLREIEQENPDWRDLSDGWYEETTNRWLIDPENP